MHAAGNAAVRQALAAIARAPHAPGPPRIDHFFFAEGESTRRPADAVVLSDDPQSVPVERLADVAVQSTCAGRIEYRRDC